MNATTLDEVLDTVMLLPLDQQEMLVDILHQRHIVLRRREIARDAQRLLAAFHAGQLVPHSLASVLAELGEPDSAHV